jgi:hypothetical protein
MKGFIGPLGDDLPSIVIIVLALSMFFAGLTFAINTYNQKVLGLDVLRGAVDIGRVITQDGLITSNLDFYERKAEPTANSYAIDFVLYFADDFVDSDDPAPKDCDPNWYRFNYLVAVSGENDVELKTLVICAGRSV